MPYKTFTGYRFITPVSNLYAVWHRILSECKKLVSRPKGVRPTFKQNKVNAV